MRRRQRLPSPRTMSAAESRMVPLQYHWHLGVGLDLLEYKATSSQSVDGPRETTGLLGLS